MRHILLLLALAGCSEDTDASPQDALQDSTAHDSAIADAAPQDSAAPHDSAAPQDSAAHDLGIPDAAPQDSAAHDLGIPDAAPQDAAADAGPAQPDSSHGQGGLACQSTGTVNGTDGQPYAFCLTTVGDVELKLIEPAAGEGPLKLALYLHGDGAGPHNSGFALKTHAPWTTSHRTLYVSAKAPNGCAWWLKPSRDCNEEAVLESDIDREGENAAALVAVIDALRGAYDLSNQPVLFGGSSGGSIFLTASFFPRFGDRYPGVYALSCGGDAPWGEGLEWTPTPAQRTESALYFTYGDKDFVLPDVLQSIAFYEAQGFPVDTQVIPEEGEAGSTHCGGSPGSPYSYNQIGRVSEVWAAATEARD